MTISASTTEIFRMLALQEDLAKKAYQHLLGFITECIEAYPEAGGINLRIDEHPQEVGRYHIELNASTLPNEADFPRYCKMSLLFYPAQPLKIVYGTGYGRDHKPYEEKEIEWGAHTAEASTAIIVNALRRIHPETFGRYFNEVLTRQSPEIIRANDGPSR